MAGYIFDTLFCLFSVAPTVKFDGSQHMVFEGPGNGVSEAENLWFRFKTKVDEGILVIVRDSHSTDRIEFILGKYPKNYSWYVME